MMRRDTNYSMNAQRRGSALIMVISLLVLLTTLAITFLELVGRQYNSTVGVAAQVKSEIAVQQAQAHLIRCFNQSAAKPTKKSDDSAIKFTSYTNHQWHREFGPVTDPDGNPFTDTVDYSKGHADQGVYLAVPAASTEMGGTDKVSSHPIVNTKLRLYELMDVDMLGTGDQLTHVFGHAQKFNGTRQYYSRWHNIEYLDAEFKTIEIDDSLSPKDKADVRRTSRYVLRYTAQALDLNGMHTINNNFPHELGTETINRGSGATDSKHFIRYQNYLAHYGRSLKSMRAAVMDSKQTRASHSYDPLDDESVAIQVEVGGDGLAKAALATGNTSMRSDWRISLERAFRDGDLQWSKRYGGNFAPLSPGHKGRVNTWSHLRSVYESGSVAVDNFMFTPWGIGMLDDELTASGTGDPVSTPWKVNLLSAPIPSMRAMVYGLHSHLRTINTWNTTVGANMEGSANGVKLKLAPTNLLGRDYPEAFPLALDSGRNVPIAGNGGGPSGPDGSETTGDSRYNPFVSGYHDNDFPTVGTRNSYVHDIAAALQLAIGDARRVWDEEKAPFSGVEESAGPWGAFVFRGNGNPSLVKPVSNATGGEEMLNLIIRETYRILGEGHISGDNPATSSGSFNRSGVFDASGETLLAGGPTLVGAGNRGSSAARGDWELFTQLEPGANTRAMEYILNDMMISLFGKANPSYVIGSKDYANIAVDFNGDTHAESTITGWWDYENNQRVWSWWWDGLGPYVRVAGNEYMSQAGWYRFAGGRVLRKVHGDRWEEITDTSDFFDYNTIWLTGNLNYPIKPFAKTGRFYIGPSKLMNGFVRGEVYDIVNEKPLAVSDRYFVYRIDPNGDDDFSDNHVVIQTDDQIEHSKY